MIYFFPQNEKHEFELQLERQQKSDFKKQVNSLLIRTPTGCWLELDILWGKFVGHKSKHEPVSEYFVLSAV